MSAVIRLLRGQSSRGTTRDEDDQFSVQPADCLGAQRDQFAAALAEHPQHLGVFLAGDDRQVGGIQPDQCDRVGVGVVGLASGVGRERAHQRGLARRDVEHRLSGRDQPVGQVLPDAVASLDRPHPAGEAAGQSHQDPEAGRGVIDGLPREHRTGGRRREQCRSICLAATAPHCRRLGRAAALSAASQPTPGVRPTLKRTRGSRLATA